MYYLQYESPVGRLLLTAEEDSLTGLWMEKEPPSQAAEGRNHAVLLQAKDWLDAYFQGNVQPVRFPMRPEGTDFQKQVWDILLTLPFGQTSTYGDIAREMALRLGKEKMSAQAVGQAVGRNPISILIPCHRVVGTNGKLTGYAGGLSRKKWLLAHEGAAWRE